MHIKQKGLARMESDVSFPSYHGIIDCQTAIDRLGTIPKPGAYLVRYFGYKYIISYFNQEMDIKHIAVSTQKDTFLWKCNPHITDIKTAVEFLLSLDSNMFAHLVPWQNFETKQNPGGIKGESFQCNICDHVFKDAKERSLHPRVHRVTYCDNCLRIIFTASFTNHKPCAKKIRKKLICDNCSYSTHFSKHLKKHILTWHTNATIKCLKCEEMFPTTTHMENHMVKLHGHHKYVCKQCGKHFKSNYHVARHFKAKHAKIPKKSQNILLLDQAQNSENMFGYVSFLPTTTQVFKCDGCEFSSTSRCSFRRHKKNVSHELTVLSL